MPASPPVRARSRAVAAVAMCVCGLALVGCGSSAPKKLGAAEPATAPPTSTAPAGIVRPVGDEPEGIVYDPKSQLVAVAVRNPDRLQLLDPSTLAVRGTRRLPGSARHLQLAVTGDEVLVPAESANQIVEVPLPRGTIRATNVLKQPHDATRAANGDVVVGNEFGKSISVIRDGKILKTVADLTQPGGVIADGDTIGVVDVGAFTLSTYSLRTLKRTAIVKAGQGPTHGVLVGANRMLVADTRGNALLAFSVDPLKRVGRLALPGTPYGLAVDSSTGTVWVTLTARNQVVGVALSGGVPRVIARYDTVRQPNTVAVEPGSHRLWITGTDTGVVELIRR